MTEAKAVYEKFINGRMTIVGSGADKDWVYCDTCHKGYEVGEAHMCEPSALDRQEGAATIKT